MKMKAIVGLWLCALGMGYGAVVNVYTTGQKNEYADGTPVLAGERMVSVIVPAGEAFGGFYDDGTLVNECDAFHGQEMTLTYDADDTFFIGINTPTTNQGDTLYFFILDTRGDGIPYYGCIGSCVIPSRFTKGAQFVPAYDPALGYVVVNTPTVPKGGPELPVPVLTGIVVDEGAGVVRLSVTNTVPEMVYGVLSTGNLRVTFEAESAVQNVPGATAPDTVLQLVVPLRATESGRFYRVRGERGF